MRLIDADEFKKQFFELETEFRPSQIDAVFDCLYNSEPFDAVNAVEVVRCKDCRWDREVCGNIECSVDCNLPPEHHEYEWFCPKRENMITTYVCEEPCNSIMVRDKKLLKIENVEYAIKRVAYEEEDDGNGLTWLVVTIRKKEENT